MRLLERYLLFDHRSCALLVLPLFVRAAPKTNSSSMLVFSCGNSDTVLYVTSLRKKARQKPQGVALGGLACVALCWRSSKQLAKGDCLLHVGQGLEPVVRERELRQPLHGAHALGQGLELVVAQVSAVHINRNASVGPALVCVRHGNTNRMRSASVSSTMASDTSVRLLCETSLFVVLLGEHVASCLAGCLLCCLQILQVAEVANEVWDAFDRVVREVSVVNEMFVHGWLLDDVRKCHKQGLQQRQLRQLRELSEAVVPQVAAPPKNTSCCCCLVLLLVVLLRQTWCAQHPSCSA